MDPQQKPVAMILTGGMLHEPEAKTAHGLIRGTDRYQIAAVVDSNDAGKDAGEVLDGIRRNIPVFATTEEAIAAVPEIRFCIIGIATIGGILPPHFISIIESCIRQHISIVNGLHDFLTDMPQLIQLAADYNVTLTDIRKPKPKKELHFWNSSIYSVSAAIIAVIGTDCALGKRTTCRMIKEACIKNGIRSEMVYTGQTGWLQGGCYGFVVDSTLNDFISGELEHAIVSCWEDTRADVIFLEGQSALRNPSGPCGSELLVSGNAKHTILMHAPKRKYYDHLPEWGKISSPASEIELIRMYGSEVIGLALNTEHCSSDEALAFQAQYEKELQIPVLLPLQQGMDKLIPIIKKLIKKPA